MNHKDWKNTQLERAWQLHVEKPDHDYKLTLAAISQLSNRHAMIFQYLDTLNKLETTADLK